LPQFPETTEFTVPADLVTGDKAVDDLYEGVANMYTGAALIRQQVYTSGSVEAHDPKSLGKSNQAHWKEIRKLLKMAKAWNEEIEEAGARAFEEPPHRSRTIPKP
jgi:hypothetical protein